MSRAHAPGRTFYSLPEPDPEPRFIVEPLYPAAAESAQIMQAIVNSPEIRASMQRAVLSLMQSNLGWAVDVPRLVEEAFGVRREMVTPPPSPASDPGFQAALSEAGRALYGGTTTRPEAVSQARSLTLSDLIRARREMDRVAQRESLIEFARTFNRWRPELLAVQPVAGDEESAVPPDTIDTLVDLARAGAKEDFYFLAGSAGVAVEKRDELWAGTRKRLGMEP